jgi:hypothetical protein
MMAIVRPFKPLVDFSVFCFLISCFLAAPMHAGAFLSMEELDELQLHSDDSINNFFMHQKNFVPGEPLNKATKTIFIAINVWQKDDGTGNFAENDFVIERFHWMIHHMNMKFRNVADPVRPVEGVEYLKDSYIRCEIKEISFYQNSDLYGVDCGAGSKLNKYVFDREPHKREYLNLHFNVGSCMGGMGYANYPSGRNLQEDSYIVSFIVFGERDEESYPYWSLMLHLAHELGHNLELKHPYDSEYCRFSHPDFLFDLFGFERQEWCNSPRPNCDVCYQQGGWNCDYFSEQTTCTNNLMGGNKSSGSITPLQMGRMNRSLALRSVRKYAWGYSEDEYLVEHNQQWAFNKKFYQDIRVKSGATLQLTGTLEMVPEASIILEPGSKLIIDSGKITRALYSPSGWQGIVKETPPKRRFAFFRKKIPMGEVLLLNGGTIDL